MRSGNIFWVAKANRGNVSKWHEVALQLAGSVGRWTTVNGPTADEMCWITPGQLTTQSGRLGYTGVYYRFLLVAAVHEKPQYRFSREIFSLKNCYVFFCFDR
jgi:hypothetical protein